MTFVLIFLTGASVYLALFIVAFIDHCLTTPSGYPARDEER